VRPVEGDALRGVVNVAAEVAQVTQSSPVFVAFGQVRVEVFGQPCFGAEREQTEVPGSEVALIGL
jgi:hypothetical protein